MNDLDSFNFVKCKILLALLIFFTTSSIQAEVDSHEEAISAGAKTYYRFCSVCHGKDAKGNGSFSENLKVTPPDLTTLSSSNNGIFPWIHLFEVIDGKDIARAHGTKEMPIWGDLFDLSNWSSHDIENANTIVRGRIFELLVYLNSVQK